MRNAETVLGIIREECHEAIHGERSKRHGFKKEATGEPR
jgi:hypothetical protein